MGLLSLLAAGLDVIGSEYDGQVKDLKDISEPAQKRLGYLDADGCRTEKGWSRMTSADMDATQNSVDLAEEVRRFFK